METEMEWIADRTLLPPLCAARLRDKSDGHRIGTPIFIRSNEMGYYAAQDDSMDVDDWNRSQHITLAQREAMEFGSMFGWDTPGAQPATWMTPQNVLRHAAEMIEPEGAWIQGALARSSDGAICPPYHDVACKWCASGAISAAAALLTGDPHGKECLRLEEEARDLLVRHLDIGDSPRRVTMWNDGGRRQDEVVLAMRAAANIGGAGVQAD